MLHVGEVGVVPPGLLGPVDQPDPRPQPGSPHLLGQAAPQLVGPSLPLALLPVHPTDLLFVWFVGVRWVFPNAPCEVCHRKRSRWAKAASSASFHFRACRRGPDGEANEATARPARLGPRPQDWFASGNAERTRGKER